MECNTDVVKTEPRNAYLDVCQLHLDSFEERVHIGAVFPQEQAEVIGPAFASVVGFVAVV